jgi:hypothetical protein
MINFQGNLRNIQMIQQNDNLQLGILRKNVRSYSNNVQNPQPSVVQNRLKTEVSAPSLNAGELADYRSNNQI